MALIDLINAHALSSAHSRDWQAVADTLNSLTTVVRDPTPITYARIRELFGEPARQLIAGAIRAVAKSDSPLAGEMEDCHTVLLNEQIGFRLDLDERQSILRQLGAAAGWSSELVDAIAALGVRTERIIETTAAECQTVWMQAAIESRIVNATALAKERMLPTDTAQQLAAKWAQAWAEAV